MSESPDRPAGTRTRLWRDGKLETEDFPFADISDHLAEDGAMVWVDLVRPDDSTIDRLAEELDLDRMAVEDATTEHERPKAVRYRSHLFVTTFALLFDESVHDVRLGRISAFVLPRGIVTVRLDDNLDMDAVVRRWDDNTDLLAEGPLALLHGLLDFVVDGYFDVVERLDDRVEDLEDLLFEESKQSTHDLQRHAFTLRKNVGRMRKLTTPMREVVTTLLRRVVDRNANGVLVPYYEDLYDHSVRINEWTDSLRDSLQSIYDTNLSLSDIRMNTIMKKLTSWAAIIAVPTAITGWYGQNVPYPGFGHEWGVVASTVAILLIAFVLYVTFKRKDWL